MASVDCPPVRFTFTQGLLLGQASMIVLAVLFLKYVVFEDPATARLASKAQESLRNSKRSRARTTTTPTSPTPAILSALSYDLPTHPPESLDWLNVLSAQTITAYRSLILASTAGSGGARGFMEEVLNRRGKAEGEVEKEEPGLVGIDRIVVGEVELGDQFPVLSNARVRPSGESGGVRIELDLDYTDLVSLSLTTCLLVNFPRPRFAVLPISLGLTLERFSGTLTLELPNPLSPPTTSQPVVHMSLHPDFTLQLSTTSLLGSRAKLQDIPKVEQLILARIRGAIQDRVVWPGRVELGLPPTPHMPGSKEEHEGWEWVDDSEEGVEDVFDTTMASLPNADSDDGEEVFGRAEEANTTTDLDGDGGPSIFLRPKVRRRQPGVIPTGIPPPFPSSRARQRADSNDTWRGGDGAPPSPTESLPGHYYDSRIPAASSIPSGRGKGGLRYRNGGGVGIGMEGQSPLIGS